MCVAKSPLFYIKWAEKGQFEGEGNGGRMVKLTFAITQKEAPMTTAFRRYIALSLALMMLLLSLLGCSDAEIKAKRATKAAARATPAASDGSAS